MVSFTGTDSYIASEELQRSVNIAAALENPCCSKGNLAPEKQSWLKP